MERAIELLKKHPNWDLSRVSIKLGIDATELGRIQREYYLPFLKRDSKAWGVDGTKDSVDLSRR